MRRGFLVLVTVFAVAGCVPAVTAPRPVAAAAATSAVRPSTVVAAPLRREIVLDGAARQGGVMLGRAPEGTRSLRLDGKAVAMDGEGRFLIAFDRDAPPAALLIATGGDGVETRLPLTVAPGQWDIQNVNAPITGGVRTSEEFQRRRAAEVERIEAARARMTPGSSGGWRQQFVWPVVARISGRFGSQRIYRGTPGSYHSGLDLAGGAGTTYVAPADGVVILVADAPYTLEGNLLIVDHGMGLNSAFLHSQRVLVREGEVVRRGQPLGLIGSTGRATGPHLHWGMKWNDARIDPLSFMKAEAPPP